MKKYLLVLLMLMPMMAKAYDVYIDGIHYSLDVDNTAMVISASPKYSGTVTIPSRITYNDERSLWHGTYTVTSINNYAFESCKDLKSVTIPSSVTSIGYRTFSGCTSLTSVTIPNSVTSIGDEAFADCNSLTSIIIPNSVTSIGNRAFSSCLSLTSITLPESLTSIGAYAFYGCTLTSIILPNGLTCIKNDTFNGCTYLSSIIFPNSLVSISDGGAFYYCISLTSITLPEGLTSIGSSAFQECRALTSVILPESLTSIGGYAFDGCWDLTSITLPDGLTSIGKRAFRGCQNITSITIPEGVTNIEEGTFENCPKMKSITLPDGLTGVSDNAFAYCVGLTSITLPKSLKSIGNRTFYECSSLTSMTTLSRIPQEIFSTTFSTYGTLHVLPGCKAAYEAAEYWKNFTIVEDAVDPESYTIMDKVDFANSMDIICKEISYTRTFTSTDWQALYVPFAMSYEDWAEEFEVARISGMHMYDYDEDGEADETDLEILRVKKGSLKPNTPYLIRAKETGEKTITLNNTTLYAAEETTYNVSTWDYTFTFTGTYNTVPGSTMYTQGYYALGAGTLHQALDSSNDLKPFRWYMAVENRNGDLTPMNKVKVRLVGEEDMNTGIVTPIRESGDTMWYDLSGRRVESPTRGLYIQNGKKVMMR